MSVSVAQIGCLSKNLHSFRGIVVNLCALYVKFCQRNQSRRVTFSGQILKFQQHDLLNGRTSLKFLRDFLEVLSPLQRFRRQFCLLVLGVAKIESALEE